MRTRGPCKEEATCGLVIVADQSLIPILEKLDQVQRRARLVLVDHAENIGVALLHGIAEVLEIMT
jgi:hypothetical protein